MKPTRFCSWMLMGLVAAVGCGTSSAGAPGPTGGSASGGKNGSGGVSGSGGTTAGQSSGGTAGGGSGGSTQTSAGGATSSGGNTNSSGGQSAGGGAGSSASGGKATGGSAGSGGARTGGTTGSGGSATGGTPGSGGQGSGGQKTGDSTGTGGAATGGTTSNTGSAGNGGNATGGGGASATGGKTGADAATSDYRPCPTDGTACKIMPFGDSITDGYNSDTPGGYRVELFRLAHSGGKNITFVGSGWNGPDTVDGAAFPHNHEGHSGWTIAPAGGRSGISTLVADMMPKFTPHIILLMIGTNDCIDNYQMADAPTRLKALIDSIYAKLPDVLIVVAQPIPSRGDASKGDDTALSDRIKTFNATIPGVVKAEADAGKHILLVDMFAPFNPNKTTLLEDQWHPNLAGYVLIGAQWYSVLKPLLQ